MSEPLDLIVIGSGPGGYVAAIRAAQLGLSVAVVEKDSKLGGTCLHRGCIPTKALLHTAGLLEETRRSSDFGVDTGEPTLNLEATRGFKDRVVEKNAKGIEFLFKKNGIQGYHGRGRLVSRHEVEVVSGAGSQTLWGKHVMVATGSVPSEIPVARTDGQRILNSDHILQLPRVPSSLVVLGAGAVGTEFASIFSAFGSQVILVEMLPRLLPLEDEEISKQLQRSFRKRKIKAHTDTRLVSSESTDAGVRLVLEKERGRAPGADHRDVAGGGG